MKGIHCKGLSSLDAPWRIQNTFLPLLDKVEQKLYSEFVPYTKNVHFKVKNLK